RVVNVTSGVERFAELADESRCAAFSPDGKTLATAGPSGTIHLWETATGQRRARLEGHVAAVHFVAFAPDGVRLASGGADHTMLVWDPLSGVDKRRLATNEYERFWAALAGDAEPA